MGHSASLKILALICGGCENYRNEKRVGSFSKCKELCIDLLEGLRTPG